MKRILIIICILFSFELSAQTEKYEVTDSDYDNNKVEMADIMRSNGKIYVVVGVIFVLFMGIIFYLYSIDKKISALEKEIDNPQEQ
ncbi:MAG: multisubunit Na+/H+ antiporter MnhB subunit [Bacteroidia bacterium]|jgi:multisubunit Na+/H+ antiporter MnhB subunit